jgi:glycosyltransferase involved in cell wall biosynthesis
VIKKIIFMGDPFRGEQSVNVDKLKNLFAPLFRQLGVPTQTFVTKINQSKEREHWVPAWKESLSVYPPPATKVLDLDSTAIIGFETPEAELKYLSEANVPWINLSLHPLRFLDDLYFEVTTSLDYDFQHLSAGPGLINFAIGNISNHFGKNSEKSPKKSILICGQDWIDRSIFFDNDFRTIPDYIPKLDSLVSDFDRVIYKPHPAWAPKELEKILKQRYNAETCSMSNIYEVFVTDQIHTVCAISSSVLTEAPHFGINQVYLEPRAKRYGLAVSYRSLIDDNKFWENIFLNRRNSTTYLKISTTIPKNHLRRTFYSWGFVTDEMRLDQRIVNLEKKEGKIAALTNELQGVHQANHLHFTQLRSAEAEVIRLRQRVEQQSEQLLQANEQAQSALRQALVQANNANDARIEFDKTLERQLREANHFHITQLQGAQIELSDLRQQLHDVHQANHSHLTQLQGAQIELSDLRQQLHDVHQANHSYFTQLQGAQIELSDISQQLHDVHQANHSHLTQLQGAQIELSDLRQQLHDVHQANHSHFTQLQGAQIELSDVRQQLHDVHQANHHHWSSAEQMAQKMQAFYQSSSWRITFPLRVAARFVRNPAETGRLLTKRALTVSIGKFERYLVKIIGLVLRNPLLANKLKAQLLRCPGLHMHLRTIVLRNSRQNLNPSQAKSLVQVPSELVQLCSIEKGRKANASKEFHIRDNERVILLYVEHTALFDRITGVQRVCHKLAAMFASHGEIVILIKLDTATLFLAPLDVAERQNFINNARCGDLGNERFYEPAKFDRMLAELKNHPRKHWLIIPEVTYHTRHQNPPTSRLIKLARNFGLLVGAIYYDVIPFLTKDASENSRKHAEYTSTLSLADIIWPISNYSAEHLLNYYVSEEKFSDSELPKISVVTLAEEMDTPRQAGDSGNIIVCVGTIDERKNQITLIQAFNKYYASHPGTQWRLKIIGLVRDNYKEIILQAAMHNPNVDFHFNASDDDVKQFYADCSFTVFPSLEEGYGLPVVESLWNLKPCICADFSSMAELHVNGGCLAANTRNVDDILVAITALIEDRDIYQKKLNEIMCRPIKTWFEYVGEIRDHMERVQFGKEYEGVIYYWVDATLMASSNTGIQRVNRQLAKHLIESDHTLVPIKWDESHASIVLASEQDLEYLSRWSGPSPDSWSRSFDPDQINEASTYLMAELPLNRSLNIQEQVITFFKSRAVRCVAIFFDAIPDKLSALYPPPFTLAHRTYMKLLDSMDSIIPISETSANDLLNYITTTDCRGLSLESRINVIDLPSEFPEARTDHSERVFNANMPCRLLSVGTVEPRKNHETLIRAFLDAEKKSERKLLLTIVGGEESFDKDLPKKIMTLIGESKNIVWIKEASDALLREQYLQANFTVFPSLEEGFGMPILESLWFGVPCICSDSGQMGELAANGGCETVDVQSVDDMSNAITRLANEPDRISQLNLEIRDRYFKTWNEYASEVSAIIRDKMLKWEVPSSPLAGRPRAYELPFRPILSLCITTYNRCDWLAANLENLMHVSANVRDKIEIVVCDNFSSDKTQEVARRFLDCENFSYFRNSANIGMLGNLPETVTHARGHYVWLVGDDDLLHQGALERVLSVIEKESPALINVNYAYSTELTAPSVNSLTNYFSNAHNGGQVEKSKPGNLQNLSAFNENFYTAIYSFIVMRKYAAHIFNQDTSGEPFSSLQTCVPSSKYILMRMMKLPGYFIGDPQITINMNVSWDEHAPIWILERIPEVYDLAELGGIPQEQINRWRQHTLKAFPHFFKIIFESVCESQGASFDMLRFVRRYRHLAEFHTVFPALLTLYGEAQSRGHPSAKVSIQRIKEAMQ